MSDVEVEERGRLQKIPVECRTCGVSESFYSMLSVDHFKERHSGHDVVSRNPLVDKFRAIRADDVVVRGNDETAATPAEPEAMPAPKEREPLARENGIKVAKVIVDMLNFPSLGGPMVRVRGFDAMLDEAFTATLLLEQGAKIREMFEDGKYLDRDASGLLYVWEPDVVEYVDDAKAKLETLGGAQTEVAVKEPVPDSVESQVIEQSAVASAVEVVMDAVPEVDATPVAVQVEASPVAAEVEASPIAVEVEASPAEVEASPIAVEVEAKPIPEPSPASPTMEVDFEVPAPTPAPPLEPTAVEPPAPSQPAPSKSRSKTAVNATRDDAAPPSKEEEEGYLLVSKSWYIQGGTGNRKEAVRISKVLKAFRWNVEPAYTIGVILDDMLSIETTRSQVSGTLIRRIERAGYRLTAVVMDKGRPIAWFKKDGSEEAAFPGEAVADQACRPGPHDSEIDLEPDVTG